MENLGCVQSICLSHGLCPLLIVLKHMIVQFSSTLMERCRCSRDANQSWYS